MTVGVSSGLKFCGLFSGDGNERNWEDEQEFAGVIICAQRKTGAVRRRSKGPEQAVTLASPPPSPLLTVKHQRIP